jgi:thioredoxin 2
MSALHVVCGACGAVNRVPSERVEEGPTCGRCKRALLDGAVSALDAQRFDAFTARNDLPVVVDFWADWCAPCKMMAPAFARVAHELRTRMRMAKVDTDAEQALAQRFAIRGIPTVIVFRGGREVDRVSGAPDAARLRQWLSQHLA